MSLFLFEYEYSIPKDKRDLNHFLLKMNVGSIQILIDLHSNCSFELSVPSLQSFKKHVIT